MSSSSNAPPSRWAQEARDLLELWVLPGLAWLLPWRVCYPLFRRVARWDWLYHTATERACAEAQARGWWPSDAPAQMHWRWQRRLVTLMDHADMFLWLRHGRRGLDCTRLRVDGHWPEAGQAALLCTFHFGTGWWGLVHAVAQLERAHALVAPLEPAHFVGRRLLWHYARLRTRLVGEALRAPALDVSRGLRSMLLTLAAGSAVMAAVDVPADTVDASIEVTLLDRRFRVPRAIFRVAVQQQIPVSVYITGFDETTGDRWLRVRAVDIAGTVETLAQKVFDELDALIRERPAHWHFWSEAPRLFVEQGPSGDVLHQ